MLESDDEIDDIVFELEDESDANSDTEQSDDEDLENTGNNDSQEYSKVEDFYVSKDKKTCWKKHLENKRVPQNILSQMPCVTGTGEHASEYEA